MRDYTNEFLSARQPDDHHLDLGCFVRQTYLCADGTTFSLQASPGHYCSPRTFAEHYDAVEVYGVRNPDGRLYHARSLGNAGHGAASAPYGWVPVHALNKFIHRHGGPRQ